MGFEVELEDVVFVDVLCFCRDGDGVSQQGEAGQRVLILQRDGGVKLCPSLCRGTTDQTTDLVRLVEEEAEVGKDHPEFLPAVAVFKLPQQVS